MFWLIFAIAIWGVVHSITASLGFKTLLCRALGDGFMRFYRLLYNTFSVLSFAPILYLMFALPDRDLYRVPSPWNYAMLAGQGLSAILLLAAFLQTDTLSFIGLRQLFEEEKPGKLVKTGFYRVMRHPLYTFGLLILWLSPSVSVNSFVVYVSLTVYILAGAYFEERKLLHEFGREYAEYKSVTPMLIPGLSKSRASGEVSAGTNKDGHPL
ncbi:MAG: isoprenylcysteine carboxylmethyltransferase family protein [Anaerolineales bacterium]|nr:isoprenylcysteine carboxylmethyltransferase family protein [Anaerolineales bacterium]NUQ83418.1 isoprenylcysteine carboxylmethyltransferase family protein [Anaerolineales bacterium]